MESATQPVRVLYSFPHKIGADRICGIAWHQVAGLTAAGAKVTVYAGAIARPLPRDVEVRTTLARGRVRIPYRLIGSRRAFAWHDWVVSRALRRMAGRFDIVHVWPLGGLRTLQTAASLGIPTVLERCNAHTRYAYEVVAKECQRLGVVLPPNQEHAFNAAVLRKEEKEYQMTDGLLCPSDFVVRTFVDQGFKRETLLRHIYGFDETVFFPDPNRRPNGSITMLSVGVCAVRKGLHHALEAWVKSSASQNGQFLIAGEFLPDYRRKLAPLLNHPSVKVLGHRHDVPDLMRKSDILVLPSVEEGFGLVVAEAMGSGCVPLVSDACTDICKHMKNGLVHRVGDVQTLTEHINLLHQNRALLSQLRAASLESIPEISWTAAGVMLLKAYRQLLAAKGR